LQKPPTFSFTDPVEDLLVTEPDDSFVSRASFSFTDLLLTDSLVSRASLREVAERVFSFTDPVEDLLLTEPGDSFISREVAEMVFPFTDLVEDLLLSISRASLKEVAETVYNVK